MDIRSILDLCKQILKDHYGSQFQGLILYGSMARGQASESSDIDLLVLLAKPFDFFAELRQVIDLLFPVQLESERLISAKPAAKEDFEVGATHLYRAAKREGVAV